jgi:MYXO-CTERM domain-containing protein
MVVQGASLAEVQGKTTSHTPPPGKARGRVLLLLLLALALLLLVQATMQSLQVTGLT